MTFHHLKRVVAPLLAGGLVLLAWSACAGSGMAMAEMACCADHHGECDMTHAAERCCGPDQPTGLSFVKPPASDTDVALRAAVRIAVSSLHLPHAVIAVSASLVPAGPAVASCCLEPSRRSTILRI